MADSQSAATPATPPTLRSNRPMSEALLSEKARFYPLKFIRTSSSLLSITIWVVLLPVAKLTCSVIHALSSRTNMLSSGTIALAPSLSAPRSAHPLELSSLFYCSSGELGRRLLVWDSVGEELGRNVTAYVPGHSKLVWFETAG